MQITETNISDLKPHPRNYKKHPPDQLAHIKASIEEHGFYRNVVVAKDGTILAGHGVVEATRELGRETVPAAWLDIEPDDPRALKVLTGDNEIGKLAEIDDRGLTEMLKEISLDGDLLGTGFDEMMLANLVFVTRPEGEVKDVDAAAEWAGAGMPEYDIESPEKLWKLVVAFGSEEERDAFAEKMAPDAVSLRKGKVRSYQYPFKDERNDWINVKFEDGPEASGESSPAGGGE